MSVTRVAHRTSPSASLADSSSMHTIMHVTYVIYVNPTMRRNFEFHVILEGDCWSIRATVAIVSVLPCLANCAVAPFDRYVWIHIGKTLPAASIRCMIAATDVAQRGCRCGSRVLSGLASATYLFKVVMHHKKSRTSYDAAEALRCIRSRSD
jgi:hypothetical protein